MAKHPSRGHIHATPHTGGHVHHTWSFHGPYYHRVAEALGARGGEEIKRDVEEALYWDTWVDADKVTVEVKDRVVTLTGAVNSDTEKTAAGEDAWSIPGVAAVQNHLAIVP